MNTLTEERQLFFLALPNHVRNEVILEFELHQPQAVCGRQRLALAYKDRQLLATPDHFGTRRMVGSEGKETKLSGLPALLT
jgi:hypothetical protein